MELFEQEPLDRLLERLATGDRAAFDGVFERLWEPVRRTCLVLLRNEADAEDAAQIALIKIYEQSSQYDRTRRALPWALAIASWECRTIARRRHRRREVHDALDDRSHGTGEEALIRHELAALAVDLLGRLSDVDQESLLATFWDTPALASGPNLRKRRERALDRLRETFRRLYGLD